MERTSFGSFYIDGEAVPAGYQVARTSEPEMRLGDTEPGMEIHWLYNGSMYVADRCACFGVSWDDLALFYRGPVDLEGRVVLIDGKPYRSWLLTALKGAPVRAPFTWPEILEQSKELGDPAQVWHCEDNMFWGQLETVKGRPEAWGFSNIDARRRLRPDTKMSDLGYRPALEPLPVLTLDNSLKGQRLCLHCKDGKRRFGAYMDSSEYDLVVRTAALYTYEVPWASFGPEASKTVTVDREAILWVEKAT